MARSFYLTTTLPYVNADPHIGFALEIVHADILARWHQLLGERVFFNTGTDEHGLKIYRKALEEGGGPQGYVNAYAQKFKELQPLLNLSEDLHFIRTTDPAHKKAAQEFWTRCAAAGDIYKKIYPIKYCVGCELEKTESELENGRCPIHPNLELEIIEEENYFFRFSKYQQPLLALYERYPDFVIPASRLGEINAFVSRGLEDFSISRLKEKMPWGVPVPGDPEHVMYVWFDALINYISTLGWPDDESKIKTQKSKFEEFWGTKEAPNAVQVAGKDNLRQQSAMWQAMLMSAGLPSSRHILIHGFITSGGQKMSKSLGNVIAPSDLVSEFGVDAARWFLARSVNFYEDSDVTLARVKEVYQAELANGLGNLVSRILTMASQQLAAPPTIPEMTIPDGYTAAMSAFNVNNAATVVWAHVGALDRTIQETEPFKLVKKDPAEAKTIITKLVIDLYTIAGMLEPIIPTTSVAIKEAIKANKKPENLFPRKD